MSQQIAARMAGVGSILTGLVVVFFYSRGVLPLTEVFVAEREMGYYLISLGAALSRARVRPGPARRHSGRRILRVGSPMLS